jgi:type III restriction enzyme
MLVLEVKGQDDQRNKTKRAFLDEWVNAINQHGGFGKWKWAVSFHHKDIQGLLN